MALSDYRLEYTSPDNEKVVFDPNAVDGPFMLMRNPKGFSSIGANVRTRRGPRQVGVTITEMEFGPRVLPIQVALLTRNQTQFWNERTRLVRALFIPQGDESPTPGTLRAYRYNGAEPLDLQVIPVDSPQEAGRTDRNGMIFDIEFFAPFPFWKRQTDSFVRLQAEDAGFEFPLEHPWESSAFSSQQNVSNNGSVTTPVKITLNGEFTNARLWNLRTGKYLEYLGTVAAGDRVEIDTRYGQRSVTHITAGGVETNAMGSLNLTDSEFWQLLRGSQEILFEADSNISGFADVSWREYFGGL